MGINWHTYLLSWGIVSDKDDALKKTRATYEKIAHIYVQSNQDRSVLAAQIAQFVSLVDSNGWVLDVGCGPGFDTAVFQQHNLQTIALDYTLAMMQAGQTALDIKANFVQGDMRCLPFVPQQFAGIWASASLLHLAQEDVPQTLSHFHSLLCPDGILYLAVKCGEGASWTEKSYGEAEPRFFTYWQPDALDTLLKTAGFTILDGGSTQASKGQWLERFAKKNSS